MTIKSIIENEPFQMILRSKELTDKRDLLEDMNPIARWLIRFFVSKPAYFGLLADGTMKLSNNEIKGTEYQDKINRKIKNILRQGIPWSRS